MNGALSLADAAAEERPVPVRARLALRMPAFLFGLGMVIYPLLTVLDRVTDAQARGRTVDWEVLVLLALAALPSLWFFAIAWMPTAYLYRDRLVASKLFLGRSTRFESKPTIEDGALTINGKALLYRFAMDDGVWQAIKARFG